MYQDNTKLISRLYSSILVPTRQTTPVNNIYNIGGKVWEWTTEVFNYGDTPCGTRSLRKWFHGKP